MVIKSCWEKLTVPQPEMFSSFSVMMDGNYAK